MVTIKGYEKRTNKDGEEFNVLVLSGGIQMIRSDSSGRFFATQKEVTVSCTMDEEQCKVFIGQQLPGSIRRVECDPYQKKVTESGGKKHNQSFS